MEKKIEIQKIYPLTPMQEGMLFHTLLDKESSAYFEQTSFTINQFLDVEILEKSFNALIERHDIFRTVFIHEKVQRPRQVVLNNREAKIFYEDISHLDNESQKKYIEEFKVQDRKKVFDLSKDILIRLSAFKLNEECYKVIWNYHHILMDGWCMGIIIKELFHFYFSIRDNKPIMLSPIRPYQDYINWLEKQNKEVGKSYWEQFLEGYDQQATFKKFRRQNIIDQYKSGDLIFNVNKEMTDKLTTLANNNHVTLNTVFQTLWGVLLQKYNATNDVVFGSVVSGRPSEINGVESMVGLFINTVPVRINSDEEKTFSELIKGAQESSLSCEKFEYFPLAQIQSNSKLKQNLFSHILVFENYPLEEEVRNSNGGQSVFGFKISDIESFEQTNYDFNLMVVPGNELIVRIFYNANIYDENLINKIEDDFLDATKAVIENPNIKVIELFTNEEKKEILDKKSSLEVENKEPDILAVSATFTAEPIEAYVKWWYKQFKENVEVKFAPYNQVFQELLDENSLISTNDGINLILVRFEDWIRDDAATDDVKAQKLERNFVELLRALKNKKKKVPYIVGLFPVSTHLDLCEKLKWQLESMALRWKDSLSELENIHIVDFTEIIDLYNINEIFDSVKDKNGHMPFTDGFYAAMGTVIARKMYAWKKQTFKVIAVDCDNTLWKGVCGEDGTLGVKVEGPYKELQSFLVQKYNEGMLLVICSKNNEADVWDVFNNNPQMILKKEHFVDSKINWNAKSENLKELAKELNLGIDSFIFIDDSSMECSEVMTNASKVLTLQIPENAEQIPAFIKHVWAFDRFKVTEEDKNRSQMYIGEKKREEAQKTDLSLNEFLKGLELKMSMNYMSDIQLARVAQLTQRTNQFNLSTIRRTEEEVKHLISLPEVKCWTVEVTDRFGDYGLVGVVITKKEADKLLIDTFLLSCRALGRGVEDAILAGIKKYANEEGISILEAKFIPTQKNAPFLGFIDRSGWKVAEQTSEYTLFSLAVSEINDTLEFIDCYYNSTYEKNHTQGSVVENEINIPEVVRNVSYSDNNEIKMVMNNWKTLEVNEENLLHKNFLMPLKNYSADDLLKLPVFEVKYSGEVASAEYIAPRNQIEEIMVNLWRDILGLDQVGVDDDFFALGGDSIKAIQVISRLHKYELKLEVKDLIDSPTIGKLSGKVKGITRKAEQGLVTGDVDLTPIQKWYFEQKIDNRNHWNLSFMFHAKTALNEEALKKVLAKLVEHHDTLRLNYTIQGGKVTQVNKGLDGELFSFKVVNLQKDNNAELKIKETANKLQRSFDIEKGPLLKSILFKTAKGEHLLIVIHHLATDGVSWRIICEDFEIGYKQAINNEEIKFQDKTDSFKEWSNKLQDYASSDKLLSEIEYWKKIEETPVGLLPKGNVLNKIMTAAVKKNRILDRKSIVIGLDDENTEKLFKYTNKYYETETNDIILAALAMAVNTWSGNDKVLVDIVGHGRENVVEDIDITRTVGWFASRYPVLLNVNKSTDIKTNIGSVKDTLRNIPNKGIGYGILKYMTPEKLKNDIKFKSNPMISFNYLGQFDQDMKSDIFEESKISTGHSISPELELPYSLEINCMIRWNKLIIKIEYNKYEYSKLKVGKFAEAYWKSLMEIVKQSETFEKKDVKSSIGGSVSM